MNQYSATVFDTIDSISSDDFASLNDTSNIYFSQGFLKAFEVSNPNISFKYIVIYDNSKAIGLANIQIISLGIDVILKNIKISKSAKKVFRFFMCNYPLKIMFCGNVFLSGEHGIILNQDIDKKEAFLIISRTIKELSSLKENRPLHAIFIKDFYQESLPITDHLLDYNYIKMPVEPNMIFKLNRNWKTFEDYTDALKSKYRVKVNKADKTSSHLTAKLFNENDFKVYKDELQQLYENTIANANFNAQVLNLNTYIKLRTLYKDDFIVKAYFLEDKLIGFLSALVNNNHLDAHFIGLDYELNKTHAIYPRILNDYVRLGIENKVSQINFGRTASEIKSTIGATPENLVCYTRHRRNFINKLLKPFISQVQIKDFKQHEPFKA
ncbi:MAG: putative N-acyltransferase [Glaciecola sp.]|jgi:predicted N-acyltransferase